MTCCGCVCLPNQVVEALDAQLELSRPVRIHFTGCPNSCGQAQVSVHRSLPTTHPDIAHAHMHTTHVKG